MENKKQLITITSLILILILVGSVNAEFWACFEKGNVVEYCGNYKPDWTCGSKNGCQRCMSVYNETENCYVHGAWPKCNSLPPGCSVFGSNTSLDITSPTITLHNPIEGDVYSNKKVLINVSTNESAKWRYFDLLKGRSWKSLCTNKFTETCEKKITLKEGVNNVSIKAIDNSGNEGFYNVSFFVDSKKPRIYKTYPKKGFADGNFEVQFKEENPALLILHYGEEIRELNISEDCYLSRGKYYCDVDVDLSDYDGQEIEYYFVLEDIAGSVDESRVYDLKVDTTFPEILNNDTYSIKGKYVTFYLEIEEENFDEVVYGYFDSRDKWREKRLCSRLKDGICEKRKSFRRGEHEITLMVLDEAGNSVGVPLSFEIDY